MYRFGDIKDVLAGFLFIAMGAFFFIGAFSYGIGTARQMGAGYFPMLFGVGAICVGIAIVASAPFRHGAALQIAWRSVVAISTSIAVFSLLVERIGLIPGVAVSVAVAALGDAQSRALGTILLAAGASIAVWLIFSVGLGLPLPSFGSRR